MTRRVYTEPEITLAIRGIARAVLGHDGDHSRAIALALLQLAAEGRVVVQRIEGGQVVWAAPELAAEIAGPAD